MHEFDYRRAIIAEEDGLLAGELKATEEILCALAGDSEPDPFVDDALLDAAHCILKASGGLARMDNVLLEAMLAIALAWAEVKRQGTRMCEATA